jgi:hypothetical protein
MSYYNLKDIKVSKKNMNVKFKLSCNNDTAPYTKDSCDIPDFLYKSLIGVYQYNYKNINNIVNNCENEISKHCNFDDFWKEVGNNGKRELDLKFK